MASSFAAAMNVSASTWNGAASLSTPDPTNVVSGRLSLFFKSVRGLSVPQLYTYLQESTRESVGDTIVLAFHIRDPREGKGERALGRSSLIWLLINYPNEFKKVLSLIPEYGRWDDIIQFFPGVLDLSDIEHVRKNFCSNVESAKSLVACREIQTLAVNLLAQQLRTDLDEMNAGRPCTLAAKWAPTEGDSLDRKTGVVTLLGRVMGVTPRQYRKTFITPLRSYLKVVESYMCSGKWDEIDFSKVPSCAVKRLKKAFEKHTPEAFEEWKKKLERGEVEVKAKQLFPHELIKEIETKHAADVVCEAQWKVLEKQVNEMGSLSDTIVVSDTSGSMAGTPMLVSLAIGILVSQAVKGPFHNHVISFNSDPKFTVLPDGDLFPRYQRLRSMDWGGSTNIQATFDLILSRALACKLPESEMPKKLIIVSDMQFNQTDSHGTTNFKVIDNKYKTAGYKRPQIVFWNVNGSSTDFPVEVRDDGTALISGFSTSIMKQVLDGKQFTPASVVHDLVHSDRYTKVREALATH